MVTPFIWDLSRTFIGTVLLSLMMRPAEMMYCMLLILLSITASISVVTAFGKFKKWTLSADLSCDDAESCRRRFLYISSHR